MLFRLSYVRLTCPAGVEPATSAVAKQRSRPLSYPPPGEFAMSLYCFNPSSPRNRMIKPGEVVLGFVTQGLARGASGRNRTHTPAVQRACAAVDTTEA